MKLIFSVPPEADGALLRNFLRMCAVSTELARAVKFHGSGFFAEGEPILANRRVAAGQDISFELPEDGAGVAPQPEIPVKVVYEDAFAIVLEKPPHLAVHPTLNYPLGTLANGYAALMEARGESPVFRPVNRIDKDTSGLVLAARNTYAAPLLAENVQKLYYAIDGLNTAINDDRKVTFRYFDWTPDGGKAYRRGGTPYETNPVALCVDKHYYLVAYDPAIQDYRHYRVDRMESLTVTDAPRDPLPEQFDLGKYVKTIFDMYNGRTETVQLRFDRALINVVMDRFGADAHIRPDGDRIAVTAPVEVGPTFYGWLFQFGGQAELLAPDHVRRDFTEHCRQALDRYRGDDAPNS